MSKDKSTESLFAVWRTRGPAWYDARPMEEQPDWAAHAAFMNALAEEGFVVLGGPLEGTRDVLLIVRATGADAVKTRLASDPWEAAGLLVTTRIIPWQIRLGTLNLRR